MSVAWFPHRPLCLVWRCSLLILPTCSLFSAHMYPWCFLLFYEVKIILNQSPTLSVQLSSVTQSCPNLCNMDCSTPGLPVHHQLPKFTQTHVHWVGDAIQPSLPLSSHSPPAFNFFPESFPIPQFKSINFSALSFLHSPTLTSIHDHWKNHRLD